MHLILTPAFPAFSRGPVSLPIAGKEMGGVVGGAHTQAKGPLWL